jgi:cytochrome oxidase Cu insertion factor (SCO1/SenC/PrrC family)
MRPDFARGRKRRSRSLPAMTALLAVVLGVAPVAGGEVEIGAPFTLTDQNGKTRADTDFRGSYMLVYFGYTFCPDICPVGLMKMTEALAALETRDPAKAARVVPVFITLDPERDTPAQLRDYAGSFSPRLVALTGTPEAVRTVAYGYGTFFARAPGGGDAYLMDHTSFTYLMGPDGRYITHFEKDVTAGDLALALAAHVAVPEPQR